MPRNASSPLPILLSSFCPVRPAPSGIWFLTSLHGGPKENQCFPVPSSLLQPRHFFTSANVAHSVPHPSSFHGQPHHIEVVVCPRLVGLSSQHRLKCHHPNYFFQLLARVCLPTSSTRRSWLFKNSIFVTSCGQTTLMPTATGSSKKEGVPPQPLDAKISGLAHDGSCRLSHLSPTSAL